MKGNSVTPVSQMNLPSLPEGGVLLSDLEAAKISEVSAEVVRLRSRGVDAMFVVGSIVFIKVIEPKAEFYLDSFFTFPSEENVLPICERWLAQLAELERNIAGWRV
ncbi:hypothetical protein QKW35_06040 [Pontibacterium granulatum]|uniref:hypothetical protein n=1 Tax=Pontibacterium granulatum TaxID=2036029 RepID=UPI00249AD417|nr:hypothetical protein [Pontibacterium granulatum]MDI3323929.1 hypothetical protein [Pontibacterium granulatum]